MHTNGLGAKLLGMNPGAFRNALERVDRPNQVGAGMVLEARGVTYARPASKTVTQRRAKNKAARKARRVTR